MKKFLSIALLFSSLVCQADVKDLKNWVAALGVPVVLEAASRFTPATCPVAKELRTAAESATGVCLMKVGNSALGNPCGKLDTGLTSTLVDTAVAAGVGIANDKLPLPAYLVGFLKNPVFRAIGSLVLANLVKQALPAKGSSPAKVVVAPAATTVAAAAAAPAAASRVVPAH